MTTALAASWRRKSLYVFLTLIWCCTSALAAHRPVRDFDGDGKTDLVLYDAAGLFGQSPGSWYFLMSRDGFVTARFGYEATIPVSGDFDGDGREDYGVYDAEGHMQQPSGSWHFWLGNSVRTTTSLGHGGTAPLCGDFDGDEVTDYGCSAGAVGWGSGWTDVWSLMLSQAGRMDAAEPYGKLPEVLPAAGDFDGDGTDDYAAYSPYFGEWLFTMSTNGALSVSFGYDWTVPIAGDFDGDGKADYGVYDAEGGFGQPPGSWYFMLSRDGFATARFGYEGTVAVIGDYDGDGIDDYGVYDAQGRFGQAPGSWYLMQSSAGFLSVVFGYPGTMPLGTPDPYPVCLTGTVRHDPRLAFAAADVPVEMHYSIVSDNGIAYKPCRFGAAYQIDGLRVRVRGRTRPDVAHRFFHAGPVIEIASVRVLSPPVNGHSFNVFAHQDWFFLQNAEVIFYEHGSPDEEGTCLLTQIVNVSDYRYPLCRVKTRVERVPEGMTVYVNRRSICIADHIAVVLQPGADESDLAALCMKYGASIVYSSPYGVFLVQFPVLGIGSLERKVQQFNSEIDIVKFAEPGYLGFLD